MEERQQTSISTVVYDQQTGDVSVSSVGNLVGGKFRIEEHALVMDKVEKMCAKARVQYKVENKSLQIQQQQIQQQQIQQQQQAVEQEEQQQQRTKSKPRRAADTSVEVGTRASPRHRGARLQESGSTTEDAIAEQPKKEVERREQKAEHKKLQLEEKEKLQLEEKEKLQLEEQEKEAKRPCKPLPSCQPLPALPTSAHHFELDSLERVLRISLDPAQPVEVRVGTGHSRYRLT
jgi:hypothetical protein